MTTERPDRGARALAERLMVHDLMGDGECARNPDAHRMCLAQADAILANGAVFLPDAAELDRLRQIEAAARDLLTTRGPRHPKMLALRDVVLEPKRSAPNPNTHHEGDGCGPSLAHTSALSEGSAQAEAADETPPTLEGMGFAKGQPW